MQRQRGFGIKIGAALAQPILEMNSMARLNATAFRPSLITSLTSDEARREAVISRMCERPGFDREKVETVLDLLREVVEERVSDDAPEPAPELRMAIAQQVAELSGKTVREVLEDGVSDD